MMSGDRPDHPREQAPAEARTHVAQGEGNGRNKRFAVAQIYLKGNNLLKGRAIHFIMNHQSTIPISYEKRLASKRKKPMSSQTTGGSRSTRECLRDHGSNDCLNCLHHDYLIRPTRSRAAASNVG